MSRGLSPVQVVGLSIAIGATGAVLGGVLLAAFSRPPDFSARTQALGARIELIEHRARRIAAQPPGAPQGRCATGLAGQMQTLRDEIAAAETRLGLQSGTIDVRLAVADAGVAPLALHLEASGPYQGAIGLLDALSHRQPAVFADKVDLVSRTSSVALSFSGRVFCVV